MTGRPGGYVECPECLTSAWVRARHAVDRTGSLSLRIAAIDVDRARRLRLSGGSRAEVAHILAVAAGIRRARRLG